MRRFQSYGWSLVAAAIIASTVPAGSAPSTSDKATAQMLFDDALKLLDKKKYPEACRKLEESLRLDPAMGTQYRLGECYEKLGRVASAWVQYREVVDAATSAGLPDRERKARERAAAIEPRLPRLIIAIPTPVPGMRVRRDGMDVGEAQYGSSVPVDPGAHDLEATAPGHEPWTKKIDIEERATLTVKVPRLKATPTATAARVVVVDEGKDMRTAGLVTASIGVAFVLTSGLLMLTVKSTYAGSDAHCTGNVCDAEGVDIRDRARSRGNIATVMFGLGAVALATGTIFWLTNQPPSASAPSARVGLWPGGLTLSGRF